MSPTATEAPLLAGANQSGTVRKPAEIIETPEDQTVVHQMQEITMEEPGCDPLPGPAHPGEVVPSSVELRWRSHDRQAAFTVSSWQPVPTFPLKCATSAARSFGRCRWPLTRRNW